MDETLEDSVNSKLDNNTTLYVGSFPECNIMGMLNNFLLPEQENW